MPYSAVWDACQSTTHCNNFSKDPVMADIFDEAVSCSLQGRDCMGELRLEKLS